MYVGIDIGGSHVTSCLYDTGTQTLMESTKVYRSVDSQGQAVEIISAWCSCIRESVAKSYRQVKGLGIAMPGPFDYIRGVSLIRGVKKFESLYGLDLKILLAEELSLDPSQVRFINDAMAFGIAVARFGKAKTFDRCVALTLGTGLGSTFIKNQMPVFDHPNVPPYGFLYNQPFESVLADDLFSTRGLIGIYHKFSGKKVSGVLELVELAKNENRMALETFGLFGTMLGKFLNPFLNSFQAECLILGGNISHALPLFKNWMLGELRIREVHQSELMEDAALIGGAMLYHDTYYSEIEKLMLDSPWT